LEYVHCKSGFQKKCKPEAKLAESERLIGQLCAENAFLKKVLTSLEAKEHQKQREGNPEKTIENYDDLRAFENWCLCKHSPNI
jgi:hypothetical protein